MDSGYFDKEVARYQNLLKKNSSSQSQLDTALRNLNRTPAQLKALSIETDILQERKQRLCIKAPPGWKVITRLVEQGKWINAGEPVVEVGDYNRLAASFALSLVEFQALKKQLNSGLKVVLPESQVELPEHRGGLTVDLSLDIPSRSGAVLVPQNTLKQSIGSDSNGTYLRLRHCLCEELAMWQSLRQLGFVKVKDRRSIARDDIFSLSKCHLGQTRLKYLV